MLHTASHLDERLRRPSGIRSLRLDKARLWLDTTDEDWAEHPEYLDDSGHVHEPPPHPRP
ncbi:hypothetical protein [Streptomyces sp. NPDC057002]|uniref:hypothetical protein n=1 Tax=Streptomyces sp. NPDC057002 TaxID=3345992 RepID=UPI003639F7C0